MPERYVQGGVLEGILNLDPISMAVVVFRSLVVYVALLGGLRLAGKRELGQMTSFDLVVILVISNAVQNAMLGPDSSLSSGLIAAGTLLGANWVVNRIVQASPWLSRQLTGTPSLLLHDGQLIDEHLRNEGITRAEVLQALREHGVEDLASVKMAVLEVDGTISVIPSDASSSRTRRRLRGRKPVG
jgi:uncharacterized membrane protein YcaP (DUF421 family)